MNIPESEIKPPYLKGFIFLLPEALTVSDKAIFSFETEELEPLLDGEKFVSTASSVNPLPSKGVGRNFVSLRFWHIDSEPRTRFESDLESLFKAFARVHPPRNDGHPDPQVRPPEMPPLYRTAVEAVTFVASEADLTASQIKPDPLSRCIERVLKWHTAYRVVSQLPIDELTYARIFPIAVSFRRDMQAETITPDGIVTLGDPNVVDFGILADRIGTADMELLSHALGRTMVGDPLISILERRSDANFERAKGNFSNAVIQLAIACEIIFDSVLGLILWESGMTPEDAADIFSTDITPRIKNQYAVRLGGIWALDRGAAGDWFDNVAGTRNRIVHAGYRATAADATAAGAASDALAKFVADRVCAKFRLFPKTAWIIAGRVGFETRNLFSRRVREWIGAQPPRAIHKWIRDYTTWREAVNAQVQRRRKSASSAPN